jgi:hypothetical protein
MSMPDLLAGRYGRVRTLCGFAQTYYDGRGDGEAEYTSKASSAHRFGFGGEWA